MADHSIYAFKPCLLDASLAHQSGAVIYDERGFVSLRARFGAEGKEQTLSIAPERQFPAIRATFNDLNKALSQYSNSPRMEDGRTLRELYDAEVAHYESLVAQAYADGRFEPDYGTYVYDHIAGNLYLIAPEYWHRLGLVTSNSNLMTDRAMQLPWREVRKRLGGAVVGFAGISVGGNILEGWLREARPSQLKIADPDWVEITNFNRCERVSLRHICGSRAERFDLRNPYDTARVSKALYTAYEQHLVDPYAQFYVYDEGLTQENIERFLLGDDGEPRLDVLVEEMDQLDLKIQVRQIARRHGIDVLMLGDFGHRAHCTWNLFNEHRESTIGFVPDDELTRAQANSKNGERASLVSFLAALSGPDFAYDQFLNYTEGRGEHPSGSVPQSGATAMASGAVGGKELAMHCLGYRKGDRSPSGVVYDLLNRRAETL